MKSSLLEKDDELYQDIEAQIARIKGKKTRYLICYRATRILIFIGGATITILTGWQLTQANLPAVHGATSSQAEPCIKNIILIISAAISVLTATEGLFSFREKGKGNNVILFDLRTLRDHICFAHSKGKYGQVEKSDFFAQYQKILVARRVLIENSDDNDG